MSEPTARQIAECDACTCDWIRYEEMSVRDPKCPQHYNAPDPPPTPTIATLTADLAQARQESEWRGEKLQSVAKFAARTALLKAAEEAKRRWRNLDEPDSLLNWSNIEAWLRSRAGDAK